MPRIADSIDDVVAIVETISATYAPTRITVVTSVFIAILLGLVIPLILFMVAMGEDASRNEAMLLIAFAAAGPFLAFTIVLDETSSYRVDEEGFTRESRICIGSWSIKPYDVASIDLERAQHFWVLVIRPLDGRVRRLALFPVFHSKLANIYPWIGDGDPNIVLPPWLKPIVYGALAVTVLLAVVLAIWYRSQGF